MEVGNSPDGGRIHWVYNPKRLQDGCRGISTGPSNLGGTLRYWRMFVRLEEISHYEEFLRSNGMEILRREELTEHRARTSDLCLEIIGDPTFWALAAKQGKDFLRYLKAFRAKRAGFSSGAFVYGLLVARKLDPATQVESTSLPFRSVHADCPAD
jgi:hypothetical protein